MRAGLGPVLTLSRIGASKCLRWIIGPGVFRTGPVVQPGILTLCQAEERSVRMGPFPTNRKAAGSNPARSTIDNSARHLPETYSLGPLSECSRKRKSHNSNRHLIFWKWSESTRKSIPRKSSHGTTLGGKCRSVVIAKRTAPGSCARSALT